MPITGFLKLPDIDGESRNSNHENEIEVWGLEWGIETGTGVSASRFGRSRARADMGPLVVHKFYDRSSPLIARAAQQQRRLDEVTLAVHQDSGEAHLDYLVITMTNVVISDYQMQHTERDGDHRKIQETIAMEFQSVEITHTVPSDDGSAGDETQVQLQEGGRFS